MSYFNPEFLFQDVLRKFRDFVDMSTDVPSVWQQHDTDKYDQYQFML